MSIPERAETDGSAIGVRNLFCLPRSAEEKRTAARDAYARRYAQVQSELGGQLRALYAPP